MFGGIVNRPSNNGLQIGAFILRSILRRWHNNAHIRVWLVFVIC